MKQILRSLCTLLMLVVWASGFAADITADFTNGNIPTGWTKKGTTQKNADYGTQLQTNASVTSPAFTEIIKTITINLTRSGNGTNFTVGYIKNGQTTVFKTFKSGDVTVKSLKDYKIEVPIEAQISGVKFVFTSIRSSYYVKTITFSSGVNKTVTTLTFPQSAINIEEGNEASFKGQPATLKAGETVLNKTITYAKSGDDIFATFDATTGAATLKSGVYGSATITATFAGDDTYEKSTASYKLTVVDPNAAEVTFDFTKPAEYGDYDAPTTNGSATNLEEGNTLTSGVVTITNVQNGWTMKGDGSKGTNKSRFHMYRGTIQFRVYDNAVLTLSVADGYVITGFVYNSAKGENLTASTGSYDSVNKKWTGAAKSIELAINDAFQFENMTVTYSKLPSIALDETQDNTETISSNADKTVNVTLTRTLTAGAWNTICLPFDVTAEQIANVLKSEGNVKEYGSEDASKQTIYFKDATTMVAGKPYLIKPTVAATELEFKGVTIKNVDELDRMVGDKYNMCGVFGKYPMKTDGTELFLTTQGKFAVPAPTTNVMRGFRAYFLVPKNTAGAALNLSFGEATGIDGVAVDAVKSVKIYNVNGQYVGTNLEALPKGLYVVGGKKVLK